MGDVIGSGSVTDCHLRSDSNLRRHTQQCSAELHHGENQNRINPNRCHHPLITQLMREKTAHCAWTNADEAVADAYTTTPSLLRTGAKKLFDS